MNDNTQRFTVSHRSPFREFYIYKSLARHEFVRGTLYFVFVFVFLRRTNRVLAVEFVRFSGFGFDDKNEK